MVHMGASKVLDKLNDTGFKVKGNDHKIILDASDLDFKAIYKLKEKLKNTIVSGVKGVSQVLVSHKGRDFLIVAAGSNLKDLIEVKGIDRGRVTSNDIHDVSNVLGIEAARQTVLNEMNSVMRHKDLILMRNISN